MFKIFAEANLTHLYENVSSVDLGVAKSNLHNKWKISWQNNIKTISKLKNYCNFKTDYEAEAFVYKIHNRKERSLLSQFRCGILKLVATPRSHLNLDYVYYVMGIILKMNLISFLNVNCIKIIETLSLLK